MGCPCTAVKKRCTCSNFIIILAAGREAVCYYRITKVDPLIESIGWFRHGVIQCFTIEHKYTWTYILIQSYTTKYLEQKVKLDEQNSQLLQKGGCHLKTFRVPLVHLFQYIHQLLHHSTNAIVPIQLAKKTPQIREFLKTINSWHIYMKFTYISSIKVRGCNTSCNHLVQ